MTSRAAHYSIRAPLIIRHERLGRIELDVTRIFSARPWPATSTVATFKFADGFLDGRVATKTAALFAGNKNEQLF